MDECGKLSLLCYILFLRRGRWKRSGEAAVTWRSGRQSERGSDLQTQMFQQQPPPRRLCLTHTHRDIEQHCLSPITLTRGRVNLNKCWSEARRFDLISHDCRPQESVAGVCLPLCPLSDLPPSFCNLFTSLYPFLFLLWVSHRKWLQHIHSVYRAQGGVVMFH